MYDSGLVLIQWVKIVNGNNEDTSSQLASDEQIIEQQEEREFLTRKKFTKFVTVMFADMRSVAADARAEGSGVANLKSIKEHHNRVMSAVRRHDGVFVKTIGGDTVSCFDEAQNAVRAAVSIQQDMDRLNMAQKSEMPVLVGIGLHSGECIVKENDISGDAVDKAAWLKSFANPGEIRISEDTYNALSDKNEIYCRLVAKVTPHGKKEPCNAYRVFWNPQEIESAQTQTVGKNHASSAKPASKLKLALIVLMPVLLVLALTLRDKIGEKIGLDDEDRSISHSIAPSIPDPACSSACE